MDKIEHGAWYDVLDPRQKATVDHALSYAENYSHAGVPGHSAHLLIVKLASILDTYWPILEPYHFANSPVRQTVPSLFTPNPSAVASITSIIDAMGAIEDLAELIGWPCFDSNQADDNFAMQFKYGGL